MSPTLVALALCVAGAALEGLAAGGGIRARFAELRLPRLSPPLAVWIVIGAGYYAMCFVILYRLLASPVGSDTARGLAVGLLCVLMLVNAGWGLLFFRLKNVRWSFFAFPPYVALAVALEATLLGTDRVAAVVLAPYLFYLIYATWWGYRLWRLNEPPDQAA